MSVLQPFQETALELREGCAEFGQALESLFHDIDQMRLELVDQMQVVARERDELKLREVELGHIQEHVQEHRADELQRVKAALEDRDMELARARDELQAARAELAQQRERAAAAPAADMTAELQTLQASLAELQRESQTLRGERDALQAQAQQTAQQLARMADLQQELAEVHQQLEQARADCRAAAAESRASLPCGVDPDTLTALAQEREALETELELVRNHAAELNETVTQQQREIAAQKSELSTELQQLRKLVEKQADLIADRAVNVRESVPAAGQTATTPTQANDPVVNSVMAQFAKLQKDVAQRRRRKT